MRQDCQAGNPWHQVIEQHAIKVRPIQLGQADVSIFSGFHPVPAMREAALEHVSEIRMVIDDQNTCPQHPIQPSDERAKDSSLRDARTNPATGDRTRLSDGGTRWFMRMT